MGDQTVDPADVFTMVLGPLQNKGGPTSTHALLAGSPAIDTGNPSGCTDDTGVTLTTDQRGVVRPQRAACDIGAFELVTTSIVLLADRDMEISGQVVSEGDIHANNDIEFEGGGSSTLTGNLTAVDDIELKEADIITIIGDATVGDEVKILGDATLNVSGIITEKAGVASIPLPTLSFAAGGDDIEVPRDGVLALPPGSYGAVEVQDRGTLYLSAGEYFMVELDLDREAVLEIDVSDGPVTINVQNELDFSRDTEVIITPSGEAGTRAVTFNKLGSRKVDIGKRSRVLGTIIAPDATVELEEESRFKGSIAAREIDVKTGATVLHHTSTTPLP